MFVNLHNDHHSKKKKKKKFRQIDQLPLYMSHM